MANQELAALITLIIICALATYGILNQQAQLRAEEEANYQYLLDRFSMVDRANKEFTELQGIYSTKGYYCVWTKDRTIEEIASTEEHEKCHALINEDQEHFCKKKEEKKEVATTKK